MYGLRVSSEFYLLVGFIEDIVGIFSVHTSQHFKVVPLLFDYEAVDLEPKKI